MRVSLRCLPSAKPHLVPGVPSGPQALGAGATWRGQEDKHLGEFQRPCPPRPHPSLVAPRGPWVGLGRPRPEAHERTGRLNLIFSIIAIGCVARQPVRRDCMELFKSLGV